jgi:hypothetical protein
MRRLQMAADPYAGTTTDEERRAVYQELLKADYERKEKIRTTFMAEWDRHRSVQLRENKAFYKHTALFAAGSFGVSFAYINNIVPFIGALHKPVLVTGWAFFAMVLILDGAIHLVSASIHGAYCLTINKNIQRGIDGEPLLPIKRWYSVWVMKALYVSTFFAFIGGMICLIGFVILNT